MKLLLVLDEKDQNITEFLRKKYEIVGAEHSFDAALQWLTSNPDINIDVLLMSEYAEIMVGGTATKDETLLRKIQEIHLSTPKAKFILVLNEERQQPFLEKLIEIGIYDFVIESAFTKNRLLEIIEEPKRTIQAVEQYLPGRTGGEIEPEEEFIVITVWNCSGQHMASTAYELASKIQCVLINFNFDNTELDKRFGVNQSGLSVKNTGILTIGEQLTKDIVVPMLKKKRGIRFLPAGHKLGQIGTPEIPQTILEEVITVLSDDNIVISPCARYDAPSTLAAFKYTDIIVIPYFGKEELKTSRERLNELKKADVLKKEHRVREIKIGDHNVDWEKVLSG